MIFTTIGDDCIANVRLQAFPVNFHHIQRVKLGKLSSLINDQSSQVSQNENKNSQLSQLSIVKYQLPINFQFSQLSTSFNILSSVYLLVFSYLISTSQWYNLCDAWVGPCASVLNWAARFSSTMPSEAAKKARTCLGEQRGCGRESTSGNVSTTLLWLKKFPWKICNVQVCCFYVILYYTTIQI